MNHRDTSVWRFAVENCLVNSNLACPVFVYKYRPAPHARYFLIDHTVLSENLLGVKVTVMCIICCGSARNYFTLQTLLKKYPLLVYCGAVGVGGSERKKYHEFSLKGIVTLFLIKLFGSRKTLSLSLVGRLVRRNSTVLQRSQ